MVEFTLKFLKNLSKNDVIGLAAQTAFFLILSIPPLLVLTLSISTSINVSDTVFSLLEFVFPKNVSTVFVNVLSALPNSSKTTFISVIGVVFSASGSVWALMKGIHMAYNREKMKFSLKNRMLALVITVFMIFAITISLGSIIIGGIVTALFETISGYSMLFTISKRVLSAGSVYIFVYCVYRFTPNVKLKGRELFWGALFSAFAWVVVSNLFGVYVSNFTSYTTVYGGIGAFFILILWLYVISLIILTGAQINGTLNEMSMSLHNSEKKTVSAIFPPLQR